MVIQSNQGIAPKFAPQHYADDDSFLILYREKYDGGDQYIPDDRNRIFADNFRIWAYWAGGQDQERIVNIDIYLETTKTITFLNEFNQTITNTETSFDNLIRSQEIILKKGNNPQGSHRYADVEVDLQFTNTTEMIILTYRDIKIEFTHLTHPSELPITLKTGDFNQTILLYSIIGLIYGIAAYIIGKEVEKRAYYVEFPSIGTIIVFLTLLAFIFFFVLFMFSPDDVELMLLNLFSIEPALILLPFIPILVFWFAHNSSLGNLMRVAIDIHNIDVAKEKTIGGIHYLWAIEKDDKLYKIRRGVTGAFKDTLLRLFLNHFEELNEIKECMQPDVIKKYGYGDPQRIYYADNLSLNYGGVKIEKNLGWRTIVLVVIGLLGLVVYSFGVNEFNLTDSQKILIVTSFISMIIFGIIIFIWDSGVIYKHSSISLVPSKISKGFLVAKSKLVDMLGNTINNLHKFIADKEARQGVHELQLAMNMIKKMDLAYKGQFDVNITEQLKEQQEELDKIHGDGDGKKLDPKHIAWDRLIDKSRVGE